MADDSERHPTRSNAWNRFWARPNDDPTKTLAVALVVSLVAAVVVSTTSVALRPLQRANLERERQARLTAMLAELPGIEAILREAGADSIETRIVDLGAGAFAPNVDPTNFDQRAAAADPATSVALSQEADIARIKRRSRYAPVYFVGRNGARDLIVLPVHGVGYQSTLYGYLALENDLNTVAALIFYQQGETPGLGSRIMEQEWQSGWRGKSVADETGTVRIAVTRHTASGSFEVDGVSGATRTGDAVTRLVHFWLGEHGFGPFLARLKAGTL